MRVVLRKKIRAFVLTLGDFASMSSESRKCSAISLCAFFVAFTREGHCVVHLCVFLHICSSFLIFGSSTLLGSHFLKI